MFKRIGRLAEGRKLRIASVAIALLVVLQLGVRYRQYAYALGWHCLHGSYAQIGGHRVRLSIWWWRDDDEGYDTASLSRACTGGIAQITGYPAPAGVIRKTDADELKSVQAFVSLENKVSTLSASSLLTLHAKSFDLYCKKDAMAKVDYRIASKDAGDFTYHLPAELQFMSLRCTKAGVPYSFYYSGPPTREGEAESILSSME